MRTPLDLSNRILVPLQVQLAHRTQRHVALRAPSKFDVPTVPHLDALVYATRSDDPRSVLVPIQAQYLGRMRGYE